MGQAEEFLAHYADEKYNPQKAHDYYMRVRKLKGRKPAHAQAHTSGASRLKKVETSKIASARKKAAHERKQIQDKLKAWLNTKDLANPATVNLKVQAFETKNQKQAASMDLGKVANDLKNAVAKAEATYKRELKKLRAKR
jgi:hypothetical protein